MTLENFVGVIVLLFGVFKVLVSILKALPTKYDDMFPFIKHDRTTAGYVLDGILFIFGVYAILHGLRLMEHLHPSHAEILNNIYITVAIYTVFGIFMIIFYSIVLYSNISINKDDNERTTYELLGLGGGFTFMLSVCALLTWHVYHNNINITIIKKSHSVLFLVALTLVLTYFNGMFIHRHYVKQRQKANQESSIKFVLIDLGMMPLASIS